MSSDPRHPDRISTAMVMADGLATIYRRWGSGRTLLLLGVSEASALALGDSFRVIVPELPLDYSDPGATRWLGGVCEGLGIAEAAIVATPALRDAALQFAGVLTGDDANPVMMHVLVNAADGSIYRTEKEERKREESESPSLVPTSGKTLNGGVLNGKASSVSVKP